MIQKQFHLHKRILLYFFHLLILQRRIRHCIQIPHYPLLLDSLENIVLFQQVCNLWIVLLSVVDE